MSLDPITERYDEMSRAITSRDINLTAIRKALQVCEREKDTLKTQHAKADYLAKSQAILIEQLNEAIEDLTDQIANITHK